GHLHDILGPQIAGMSGVHDRLPCTCPRQRQGHRNVTAAAGPLAAGPARSGDVSASVRVPHGRRGGCQSYARAATPAWHRPDAGRSDARLRRHTLADVALEPLDGPDLLPARLVLAVLHPELPCAVAAQADQGRRHRTVALVPAAHIALGHGAVATAVPGV